MGSQIDVAVTSAALVVAIALLVQRKVPRFAELSSAMFGLFYCGCLPCFWVKLRCLAAPALNTSKKLCPCMFNLLKLIILQLSIGDSGPLVFKKCLFGG